jgi:hypothetical protein
MLCRQVQTDLVPRGACFAGSSYRYWMLMTCIVVMVSVMSEGVGGWQVKYWE